MSTTASGPAPPIPPLIGATGPSFPNAPTIGDAKTQLGDAWHDLMYTLSKRNPRQTNRVRIYASQMMGAVR